MRHVPRVAVFSPSPLLTVTVEPGSDRPEVHLHPGGQGFWVARMAANLGADVVLCCALGGEPGRVLSGLLEAEPLTVRAADADTANGVYVHDRRSGERVEVVCVESRPLTRHASDELYGIAVGAGLDADVTLLTGCQPPDVLDASFYRRLASDLSRNGKLVVADLTGPPLVAALEAGIELLKLSDEELLREERAIGGGVADLLTAARSLVAAGARRTVVSRGSDPVLFVQDGANPTELELRAPVFRVLDHRGAGDSMFAAIGVGLARGMSPTDAVRLGMAAGALNVTRRGLGTGTQEEIERLAQHVTARPVFTLADPTTAFRPAREAGHGRGGPEPD
jgi:1-phosphofructokinase